MKYGLRLRRRKPGHTPKNFPKGAQELIENSRAKYKLLNGSFSLRKKEPKNIIPRTPSLEIIIKTKKPIACEDGLLCYKINYLYHKDCCYIK